MMASAGEFVVKHGVAGHVGRFRPITSFNLQRGVSVVIRSRRGLELGELLCPASEEHPALPDEFIGELLRPASSADFDADAGNRRLGREILEAAERRAGERGDPLSLLDIDVALDRSTAVLHALRYGACDSGPLLDAIGNQFGMVVRMYELNAEGPDDHGCGSCGSGGGCGSCSAGGCSSCSAGAARDLAAYFAELRSQMEHTGRVPLV